MVNVYLDSASAHPYARENDELALHAVELTVPWNGWVVPVVTADEFRRFIASNASNDPRGAWNSESVVEIDGMLRYAGLDYAPDEWEEWLPFGTDEHGATTYAIDGWTWQA